MDQHAAEQLKIFIDNDGDLYRQQTTSILKNLVTKMARDQYDHEKAAKLFGYLVESGAKKYARDSGDERPWHLMFSPATRRAVARRLASDFLTEAQLGNYDSLLPKKYRDASSSGSVSAAKKRGATKRRGKSAAGIEGDIRDAIASRR